MELPSTGRRVTATWPLSGRPTISLSSCYKRENRSRSRSLGPPCRTPASGRVRGRTRYPLGELNPCFQVENPLILFARIRHRLGNQGPSSSVFALVCPNFRPYIGHVWTG